jgi:hypothetical protein
MSDGHFIQIRGCSLAVLAKRSDRPWGHAIEVEVHEADATICGTILYACHPEFRNFDEFQALSTDALIALVRQRLTSEVVAESCSAFGRGIRIGFRLNAPDDEWDAQRKLAGS